MKPNDSGNFTPSQVGVLVEKLNQRFDLLAEGQNDLRNTVEGVRINQARTLETITLMKMDMNRRFNAVDKRFDSMDMRFDSVESRLERLESAKT